MADKENTALIPLPAGALQNLGTGPQNILSVMVSDALALARQREQEKSLVAARYRLGNFEFRDPDYRQILIWAKALELEPEEFVDQLEHSFEFAAEGCQQVEGHKLKGMSHFLRIKDTVALKVEDGAIVYLKWNLDIFPITHFEWVDRLRIKGIGFWRFRTNNSTEITFRWSLLDSLERLFISPLALTQLDLSNFPALRKLHCDFNDLSELDFSNSPLLTEICCAYNKIVALDLAKVSALTRLQCIGNQLIELDMSNVPALAELNCGYNKLAKLDLSNAPALTQLNCKYNKLSELDLSNVPAMEKLYCENNKFLELDIRYLSNLKDVKIDPSVTLIKLPAQDF
jgi:hypothetical protein